jgi:hypothetical protein
VQRLRLGHSGPGRTRRDARRGGLSRGSLADRRSGRPLGLGALRGRRRFLGGWFKPGGVFPPGGFREGARLGASGSRLHRGSASGLGIGSDQRRGRRQAVFRFSR